MTKRSPTSLQKRNQKGKSLDKRLLASSIAELGERVNQLDEQLKIVGRSIEVIWANQKELSKSEELLDEQFAVSTRMTITNFNQLSLRWNQLLTHLFPGEGPSVPMTPERRRELIQMQIGYSDVNKLFADWAQFRQRSDYREYMREWFMGQELDTLPPPPAKKEGEANASDSGNPPDEAQPAAASDRAEGAPAAVPEV